MQFPKRHKAHTLEQESETFLLEKLPQDWIPNKPQKDYGVDFQIGITEDSELRGLELIVQLKASDKSSNKEEFEDITLKVSTYSYLKKLLSVVMLIKYVKHSNEAYWIFLRDIDPPNDEEQESFTVHIPKGNMLSSIDWENITTVIRQITNLKLGAVNG